MKVNLKNFKNVLNREELRQIKGGDGYEADNPSLSDMNAGKCDSVCSSDATCQAKRPDSYCTYVMCNTGSDTVRRFSCQWIND